MFYYNILQNFNIDNFEPKTRGLYWLYLMIINGYRVEANKNQLLKYGYTLDDIKPPDDNQIESINELSSDNDLSCFKISALQGSKQAAYLLGKYYEEIINDIFLAEYWYRIGAQNNSSECQLKLSQILMENNDSNLQIRGKFWMNQALKNGYIPQME